MSDKLTGVLNENQTPITTLNNVFHSHSEGNLNDKNKNSSSSPNRSLNNLSAGVSNHSFVDIPLNNNTTNFSEEKKDITVKDLKQILASYKTTSTNIFNPFAWVTGYHSWAMYKLNNLVKNKDEKAIVSKDDVKNALKKILYTSRREELFTNDTKKSDNSGTDVVIEKLRNSFK